MNVGVQVKIIKPHHFAKFEQNDQKHELKPQKLNFRKNAKMAQVGYYCEIFENIWVKAFQVAVFKIFDNGRLIYIYFVFL